MKPEICVRITGTRTGKLRARVETTIKVDYGRQHGFPHCVWKNDTSRFEVTVGGEKWAKLPVELRSKIYDRACAYVKHLSIHLEHAKASVTA